MIRLELAEFTHAISTLRYQIAFTNPQWDIYFPRFTIYLILDLYWVLLEVTYKCRWQHAQASPVYRSASVAIASYTLYGCLQTSHNNLSNYYRNYVLQSNTQLFYNIAPSARAWLSSPSQGATSIIWPRRYLISIDGFFYLIRQLSPIPSTVINRG